MNRFLTRSMADYLAARKFLKTLLAGGQLQGPERQHIEAAIEALGYAAIRLDNPPLTLTHLKQMHGQPVYCASATGGPTGGGIINGRNETVLLLDGDGVMADVWFWNSTGKYYRFPLNGVDLLDLSGGKL